ncbi:MAG: hypothetical protein HPZ91_09450 [Lentisphaeria bacterium]|nr:hypothetical protein [Lentisphaeria bacterium]
MTWFRTHEFFTAARDPEVERQLGSALPELAAEAETLGFRELAGICLGGGYGRGEGGVHTGPDGCGRLYNDLDFFVFTDGASRKRRAALDAALAPLARRWSGRLGIDVDFCPAKNRDLSGPVVRTLMLQELKHGHVQICGEGDVLGAIPALEAGELSPFEGVRLLMNRGMGLLLAAEKLRSCAGKADVDFILRNLNKAVLGGGDALLLGSGRYRWKAADRLEAFGALAQESGISSERTGQYEAALEFKFRPHSRCPEDWEFAWNRARGFWRECVCRFANSPDSVEPERVPARLREAKVLCGGRNLRHQLRWVYRTRTAGSVREWFEAPELRVLSELFRLLAVAGGTDVDGVGDPARRSRVHRLWSSFL